MRRFLFDCVGNGLTNSLLIATGLFLAACDTIQEEPTNEVHLSISPYATSSAVELLTIDNEQAAKLAQFPSRQFQRVLSELEISWEPIDLPASFNHSVYMLISVPAINMTQLIPFGTSLSNDASKSASTDSMDVWLYFFVVEKPEVTYPPEINIQFSVNDAAQEVTLSSSHHMIGLEKQLISAGTDLREASSHGGINVRVSSTQIDTSIIPVSLLSNLVFTAPTGEASRETRYLAGNCLASILNKPCHESACPNHHLAADSQIRFLLLSK